MISFLGETLFVLLLAGLLGCAAGCVLRRFYESRFAGRKPLQPVQAVRASISEKGKAALSKARGETRDAQALEGEVEENGQQGGAGAGGEHEVPQSRRSGQGRRPQAVGVLMTGLKISEEKPETLAHPLNGKPDDLQKINGIGSALEKMLFDLGVFHYRQIADWSRANVHWVDGQLNFKGRVDRENWVSQARALAAGALRARAGEKPVMRVRTDFVTPQMLPPDMADTADDAEAGQTDETPPASAEEVLLPRLDGPRGGKADDLKKINGVGPKIETMLNDLGIYHFEQVANWTDRQVAYVDEQLDFPGRIERDEWIDQAARLVRNKTLPSRDERQDSTS